MSEVVIFHGDAIHAERIDGRVIVAVKPIVDRLGIDWEAQRQRIVRDELLNQATCVMQVETPAGPRESVGLPLELLPGFLFGISAERVSDPAARAAIIAYKRKCHEVLFRHFFGPREEAQIDWEEAREKLALVRELRLTHGKAAAAKLWGELGLPLPEEEPAPTRADATQGVDFVRLFLKERTAEAPGGRVSASELYRAFCAWCTETKSPVMTMTAFGLCARRCGLQKSKMQTVHYFGIRILHLKELVEG